MFGTLINTRTVSNHLVMLVLNKFNCELKLHKYNLPAGDGSLVQPDPDSHPPLQEGRLLPVAPVAPVPLVRVRQPVPLAARLRAPHRAAPGLLLLLPAAGQAPTPVQPWVVTRVSSNREHM